MSWIKQTKNPSTSSFGGVSRTEAANGLVVGQFMGEVYESLPGHDQRLPELLSTKEKVMIEILNVLVTKKIHVCNVALV